MQSLINKDIQLEQIFLKNFINLSEEELTMVLQWRNDDAVRKYVANNPRKISLSEHRDFLRKLTTSQDKAYFLVKNNQRDLGVVSLLNIDLYNRRCLWGDYANPAIVHRGVGIILEYAALYLAFDELNLHCLRCETFEENKSALRLHDFFGFQTEGTLRDYMLREPGNRFFDVIIMSVTKDIWVKEKAKYQQMFNKILED